jgi:uncharacterized membrane protein
MTPLVHAALVFAHLAGAIVWLGGMVFAHFALRPAAVLVLEPPVRLPLMAQALGRFFRLVAVAVVAIVVSGWVLLARVGMAHAPVGWHVMLALGLVMAGIFVFIYARLFPVLVRAVAAQQWQVAAGSLNRIRGLVFVNLCLGFVTVASAVLARG